MNTLDDVTHTYTWYAHPYIINLCQLIMLYCTVRVLLLPVDQGGLLETPPRWHATILWCTYELTLSRVMNGGEQLFHGG